MKQRQLPESELAMVLQCAIGAEESGKSESPQRNWKIAHMVTEITLARIIFEQYGITDKIETLMSTAPDPLIVKDEE